MWDTKKNVLSLLAQIALNTVLALQQATCERVSVKCIEHVLRKICL